jgi:signal transduction histidine kinase
MGRPVILRSLKDLIIKVLAPLQLLMHGKIELNVRNRINHIVTEVSDSGIGINKEEFSKVFEEFYRASNIPRDIKTGSGPGLSIVKQIIDDHKGQIWVNSEPGVWTMFTFILPKTHSTNK